MRRQLRCNRTQTNHDLWVSRNKRATLVNRKSLAGTKAEHTDVADAPNALAVLGGAERLSCILDDANTRGGRSQDGAQTLNIGEKATVMRRQDRKRVPIEEPGEIFQIEVETAGHRIASNRLQTRCRYQSHHQRARVGGYDDLVSPRRLPFQIRQCDVESRGPRFDDLDVGKAELGTNRSFQRRAASRSEQIARTRRQASRGRDLTNTEGRHDRASVDGSINTPNRWRSTLAPRTLRVRLEQEPASGWPRAGCPAPPRAW